MTLKETIKLVNISQSDSEKNVTFLWFTV